MAMSKEQNKVKINLTTNVNENVSLLFASFERYSYP